MAAHPTDSTLVKALNALVSPDGAVGKALPGIADATPINPSIGIGTNPVGGSNIGGSGSGLTLTGPLTIVSSDGIFSLTFDYTATFSVGTTNYKLPVVG